MVGRVLRKKTILFVISVTGYFLMPLCDGQVLAEPVQHQKKQRIPLSPVPFDATENYFLVSAKVKHSGVHIGDGYFLAANHRPKAGGKTKATIAQNLAAERETITAREFDFTLPDDPALWAPYLRNKTGIKPQYDLALEEANTSIKAPAATMIIYNDPTDLEGNILNTGFPKLDLTTYDRLPSEDRVMFYSRSFLSRQDFVMYKDDLGGEFFSYTGLGVADGMSGGPVFLEADPDGDGKTDYYLFGTTPMSTGALSLASHYHDLAALIQSRGRHPDNFPTHVLVSSQTLGSKDIIVEGTFFHEEIYGSVNNDILRGGGGDDMLEGKEGQDVFVFETGGGHDIVKDFALGEDEIDISYIQTQDFNFLVHPHSVVVSYNDSRDTITFEGIFDTEDASALQDLFLSKNHGPDRPS